MHTLHDDLVAATCETLENMAFLAAAPAEEGATLGDAPKLWARAALLEREQGAVTVWCHRDLALHLYRSALGDPTAEAEDAALRDTLAETANVIAGRAIAHRLPGMQVFQLDLPETGTGEPPDVALTVVAPLQTEVGLILVRAEAGIVTIAAAQEAAQAQQMPPPRSGGGWGRA